MSIQKVFRSMAISFGLLLWIVSSISAFWLMAQQKQLLFDQFRSGARIAANQMVLSLSTQSVQDPQTLSTALKQMSGSAGVSFSAVIDRNNGTYLAFEPSSRALKASGGQVPAEWLDKEWTAEGFEEITESDEGDVFVRIVPLADPNVAALTAFSLDRYQKAVDAYRFTALAWLAAFNGLLFALVYYFYRRFQAGDIPDQAPIKTVKPNPEFMRILEHSNQGILFVGPDLIVKPVFTEASVEIFNEVVKDRPVAELLFPYDPEKRASFEQSLAAALKNGQPDGLPEEIELSGGIIAVAYIPVDPSPDGQPQFMLMLTNVTEQRSLELANQWNNSVLNRLIHVVTHPHDFDDLVADYQKFVTEDLDSLMQGKETARIRAEILYRTINNFRGNFSQMCLSHVASRLMELESELNQWLKNPNGDEHALLQIVHRSDFHGWLQSDLQELEHVLGPTFFERKDHLSIHISRMDELKERIVNLLPPYETRIMVEALDRLNHRPFQSLFSMFPGHVAMLAKRLDKMIKPCVVIGSDFAVDPKEYQDFTRSLLHIFQNAVDHGIEMPDERFRKGKDDTGEIRCEIRRSDDWIEVMIRDDGRGIDLLKVKEICLTKGFHTEDELEAMTEQQLLACIFLDGFTTSDQITDLSGRGVGLAVVKQETEKLGGQVKVESKLGDGTVITLQVPAPKPFELETVEMADLLDPTIEAASNLLAGSFGLEVLSCETEEIQELVLNGVTSFLHIRGMVDGVFVFCVEPDVSLEMVKAYVMDELTDEEIHQFKPDVVGECSNLIMGGISQLKSGQDEWLRMATPITSVEINTILRYNYGQMWMARLHTQYGTVSLGFIVLNH